MRRSMTRSVDWIRAKAPFAWPVRRGEQPQTRLDDLGWRNPLEFGSSKGAGVDSLSFFLLTLFSQHFSLPVPHPSAPVVLHKRNFRLSLTRTLSKHRMMS